MLHNHVLLIETGLYAKKKIENMSINILINIPYEKYASKLKKIGEMLENGVVWKKYCITFTLRLQVYLEDFRY